MAEFRLLGPVDVGAKERLVDAGRPRQRAVLAALLVDAGLVVSRGTLVDRVWGESPPYNVEATLRAHITRIRRVLERAAADDGEVARLVHSSGGYLLDVDPDQVDLHHFRRLLHMVKNAGDEAEKAALLRRALSLWRGQPLAGIAGDWAARMRENWNRERVEATVRWADAEIAAGDPSPVLRPLAELSAEHPLVESLTAALMRAMHAAGRTAEALDTYAVTRRRLTEELGIDPGAELRELHQSLLCGAASGPSPMPVRLVPAQLPADVYAFAGRSRHLADLDGLLADPRRTPTAILITAVSGTAGVGKTSLAVHWAHRVAGRFPDGILYVNLRGFDPGGQALEPAEAVRGFLDALGVPVAELPRGIDAQAARYRSLISGRRMLVVLDNARDAGQVRPLLPGTPTAVVVVTSRNQLTGLVVEGAHPVTLDLMSADESGELLTQRIGRDRVRREAAVTGRIVELCAGLPLALAIVGARTQQTGFPLEALAADLGTEGRQLDALDAGDAMTRVRAVFSWSYRALTPAAGRLFRLLGVHPGADIGLRAAASLAGHDETRTRELLAELTQASLVTEHTPGRYALHDLLRAYAAELTAPAQREEAFGRLLDHYLYGAVAADRMLHPLRRPSALPLPEPAPDVLPVQPADPLAWFDAERRNLLAVLTRSADLTRTWLLAWAVDTALERQGHWHDCAGAWEIALSAAALLKNSSAQAFAHRRLAHACTLLGREEHAGSELRRALELYEEAGDLLGQSVVHHSLSFLYDQTHDTARALHHAKRSLSCSEQAGDTAGQATALNAIGWCHAQLGDHAQALTHCQRAVRLLNPDDHRAQGDTWDSIGYAHHHLGNFDEAAEAYRKSLTLARRAGAIHLEATVLTHLGDAHRATGDAAAARAAWQSALDTLRDIDPTAAAPIRDRLALLPPT